MANSILIGVIWRYMNVIINWEEENILKFTKDLTPRIIKNALLKSLNQSKSKKYIEKSKFYKLYSMALIS